MRKPSDGAMLDWLLARACLTGVGSRWPSKTWPLKRKQSYSRYVIGVTIVGREYPLDRKTIASEMRREHEQAKASQA